MERRNTLATAGLILTFAGLAHLVRVVYGWDIIISGYSIPMAFSYLVVIVALFVGFNAIRWSRRRR